MERVPQAAGPARPEAGRTEDGWWAGKLGASNPSGAGRVPPQGARGREGPGCRPAPRAECQGLPHPCGLWTERGWLGLGAGCWQGLRD